MENSASAREDTGSTGTRKLSPASVAPVVGPTGPIRNRWALLVGVNHYIDRAIPDLRFCVNDVIALEKMLKAQGYTTVTSGSGASGFGLWWPLSNSDLCPSPL